MIRTARSSSDWKDSRLVIAALSVAGTATFMSTVVLPITNSALTARLEKLATAEEQITQLRKSLEAAEKKAAEAESIAAQAMEKTPFLPGSVYPSGADKVLIGSTRQQLLDAYPGGTWDEDQDYYSVRKTGHPHFGSITYYFMGSPKKNNVTMILFHLNSNSPLNNGAIRNRFRVLWGVPDAVGKRGKMLWKATQRESIEMDDDGRYIVHAAGEAPLWVKQKN